MENLTKTEGNEVILQNGGYKMHTFEEVKEVYLSYISDEKSKKLIEDAYAFVCKKHAGIYRKSGEPYVHHLIEVAYIIATLQGGPVTIASGLSVGKPALASSTSWAISPKCNVSLLDLKLNDTGFSLL